MPSIVNNRRTWRLVALGSLIALTTVLIWLNAILPQEVKTTLNGVPELRLTVLDETIVLQITIDGQALPTGLPLRFVLSTAAGPYLSEFVTDGDSVEFRVAYQRAGQIHFGLWVADWHTEGILSKQAGEPVTPLELNIGSRMARVTGDDDPALVVHPLDAQKNVSNEVIEVLVRYPDGSNWRQELQVSRLHAWTFMPHGRQPGQMEISVTSGQARGERGEVDLLPGTISSGLLTGLVTSALASGRDTWDISLHEVRDSLGHPVTDGSAIRLLGGNEQQQFFLSYPVIQASANLHIPAFSAAGQYQLRASASNYQSELLELWAYAPELLGSLPEQWSPEELPLLELGPVIDNQGSLLDDGTPVRIEVYADNQLLLVLNQVLINGILTLNAANLPSEASHLQIFLAGHSISLPVARSP